MPRREESKVEIASANEIPSNVIGAVVIADLAQIEADAASHQDPAAQNRILNAVKRLREIALAEVSPTLLDRLPEIEAILSQTEGI